MHNGLLLVSLLVVLRSFYPNHDVPIPGFPQIHPAAVQQNLFAVAGLCWMLAVLYLLYIVIHGKLAGWSAGYVS